MPTNCHAFFVVVGAHPVGDALQGVCHAQRSSLIAHGVGSYKTTHRSSPTGWAPTKQLIAHRPKRRRARLRGHALDLSTRGLNGQ